MLLELESKVSQFFEDTKFIYKKNIYVEILKKSQFQETLNCSNKNNDKNAKHKYITFTPSNTQLLATTKYIALTPSNLSILNLKIVK